LLATAGLGAQSSRFPSWIPDWTRKREIRFSPGIGSSMATYSAAGRTKLHARYDGGADELVMRGILFDQVDEVIWLKERPLIDLPLTNEHDQASYLKKCDAALYSLPSYPTGESLFDVQWRTLIANRAEDGSELTKEDQDKMRQSHIAFREKLHILFSDSTAGGIENKCVETEADGYEFEASAFYSLGSHVTMCVTARGYVGLVPVNAVKGDWICVFYGCPVPFVIRKSTVRDGGIFQLVQKAYLHGIMAGEVLSDKTVKEQDIRLY
jgi:hypothetical protein